MRRHLFLLTVLAIKTILGISVNLHSVSLLSSYVPVKASRSMKISPKNVLRAEETIMTGDWQQWGHGEILIRQHISDLLTVWQQETQMCFCNRTEHLSCRCQPISRAYKTHLNCLWFNMGLSLKVFMLLLSQI